MPGLAITCCNSIHLTRFMIHDAMSDLAPRTNKAPQACEPALYIAESVSHCDQRHRNCQTNAEHVLGNESQVKPCPILREFENIGGKESCHEASRQKYDRHDGEHHNAPAFLSSFQCPIPRNANLDRIGMLLLQVEHFKQVILNAFSALAHTANFKKFGANGFLLLRQVLQCVGLCLRPKDRSFSKSSLHVTKYLLVLFEDSSWYARLIRDILTADNQSSFLRYAPRVINCWMTFP